jgi:glycosyltransferase involved in cell wall biosynthesis
MRCPTLDQLPTPENCNDEWPWREETPQISKTMADGTDWPLISIVTPSFNQADYLERTIRSVLLQGYPYLEYFVYDGGSTDGSVELIKKYDPWIDYWVSEKDNGQSDAINRGWSRASGDIIAWINSDDQYTPGTFQAVVKTFMNNPYAGLVYGDAQIIDDQGNNLGIRKSSSDADKKILLFGQKIIQPTSFIRADIAKRVGPLDASLYAKFDYDFFIRVTRVAPSVYLPRKQAIITLHSDRKSNQSLEKNWHELFSVLKRHNKFWFISPLMAYYLRYKLWDLLPSSIQAYIRKIRSLPRDKVMLSGNMDYE